MTDELAQADAALRTAITSYTEKKKAADQAQSDLFDAAAAAIRAGRTAEELAAEVPFSAAYIRRQARERGVGAHKTGPKPGRPKGS